MSNVTITESCRVVGDTAKRIQRVTYHRTGRIVERVIDLITGESQHLIVVAQGRVGKIPFSK